MKPYAGAGSRTSVLPVFTLPTYTFPPSPTESYHPTRRRISSGFCHEPNNTIMNTIMIMFQSPMKILKYRRLRRNSLNFSPSEGSSFSSPNESVGFLFLSLKFNTAQAFINNVPATRISECQLKSNWSYLRQALLRALVHHGARPGHQTSRHVTRALSTPVRTTPGEDIFA